jgi:hypothetical protein
MLEDDKKRYGMKEGGAGIEALRKVAPEVVERMGYVIEVAQEFAGSGPVEGPGSGISDSIPARLSDGEFVFTAKAVEEIGADELMRMMKDAEANADKRLQAQYGGLVMEDQPEKVVQTETRIMKPADATSPALGVNEDDMIQEEVTRNMLDPRVQHVRS